MLRQNIWKDAMSERYWMYGRLWWDYRIIVCVVRYSLDYRIIVFVDRYSLDYRIIVCVDLDAFLQSLSSPSITNTSLLNAAKRVGLVQIGLHHHFIEINLFSPWHSWKIAGLALSNNHSPTQTETNFIVYRTRVEHAHHYTTDAVAFVWCLKWQFFLHQYSINVVNF
jgi:hypothetical protein